MSKFNVKTIDDITVKSKTVLVRCDFNVPIMDNKITDERVAARYRGENILISPVSRSISTLELGDLYCFLYALLSPNSKASYK